jgi:predicted DNA-binding transcriptional regulator AlpA
MSHQLKLCTWKELKEVYGIPYCRLHIRRLELNGQFPQRVQLGERRVAWLALEVEQWIQGRLIGAARRILLHAADPRGLHSE